MLRYLLFFTFIVLIVVQEGASIKWQDRQVFSFGSPPHTRTTTKKPDSRPSWFPRTWGPERPRWVDFPEAAPRPGNTNNKGPTDDECVPTSLPLTVESKCCGVDAVSNTRIVGGNVTSIDEHPWLIRVEYRTRDYNYRTLCGGFLISNRYVLSAAHCFAGPILYNDTPMNIILGEFDERNEGKDCVLNKEGAQECTDGAVRVPIESYNVHEEYFSNNVTNVNDIAIVRLNRTIEYTKFIRPICLPSSDTAVSPPPGLRLVTAGWGAIYNYFVQGFRQSRFQYDDLKRAVEVPFVDNVQCREQFHFITQRHMCAGGEEGRDSCRGDSGGPLMRQRDGVFEAVGLVSTGAANVVCGTKDRFAVYTNTYQYREWINRHIQP